MCAHTTSALARALRARSGITVEGANTLTRSLIIFGQGVTRSHPHLYDTMLTLTAGNDAKGFQRELGNMVSHTVSTSLSSVGARHAPASASRAPRTSALTLGHTRQVARALARGAHALPALAAPPTALATRLPASRPLALLLA